MNRIWTAIPAFPTLARWFRAGCGLLVRHQAAACGVAAALICLCHLLWVPQPWEDFLVSFRYSEQLCAGNGLVYEVGRRVQGFVSPLGVLLPAGCHWLTGMRSVMHALWLWRLLFGIPAMVLSALLLLRLVQRLSPAVAAAPALAVGMFLLEPKTMTLATNGMETGLLVLFFLWGWSLLADPKAVQHRWLPLGLAWAGLCWTRTDGIILLTIQGVAVFALANAEERRQLRPAMIWGAALALALILPWWLWTWWYYGSPLPQAMVAMGWLPGDRNPWGLLWRVVVLFPRRATWVFGPIHPHFFSWPAMVHLHMVALGLLGAGYWLLPWFRHDRLGRQASLIFFLSCSYLAVMDFVQPWHYPIPAVAGAVVFARFLLVGLPPLVPERHRRPIVAWGGIMVLLSAAMLSVLVTWQQHLREEIIEEGVRSRLGRWLERHAGTEDLIYLNAPGHIGYFSRGRVRDYPGILAPEVTALRRQGKGFLPAALALHPEWVVMRLLELMAMGDQDSGFRQQYELVQIFENNAGLNQHLFIPGESLLLYDVFFLVFRRRTPPVSSAEPDAVHPSSERKNSAKG